MKPVDRQKMCLNCDGRVPFESIACPYCSADLSKAPEVEASRADPLTRNQAIQDSLTSLYTPPYKGKKTEAPVSKSLPKEPRLPAPPAHHGGTAVAPGALPRDEDEEKAGKSILLSILALSIGSILFILGLLQIFFSSEGVLRLEWSTRHWFIYTLTALPLLYFGYRKAEQK